MKRRSGVVAAAVLVGAVIVGGSAAGASPAPRSGPGDGIEVPDRVEPGDIAAPDDGPFTPASIDEVLAGARGTQRVLVRLTAPSLAEGGSLAAADSQQDAVAGIVGDLGGRVVARVSKVLNGVFVDIDASQIDQLAADRRVESVTRVRNYSLDLSETVPYIGATAVHGRGDVGAGVVVAVLDSGVDYTHAALGGPGTAAAYEAAAGPTGLDAAATTRDGLFPTAKVIEGYDFVGETWSGDPVDGSEAPDPDPIDYEGHGTHVADIIAGDDGVAPGASLFAVKVCSAVATSCSGMALIQAMDLVVDPNEDGDTSDHVDIVNMSLGSDYGTAFDDDLSTAVDNATALGVLSVAAAGNGGNKPFIAGTPADAPTALAVAQTEVPSGKLDTISFGGDSFAAVFQPWSPAPSGVLTAPVQYGDGSGGNLNGCASFPAGSLAGKIVLVDRGTCDFTLKMANVSDGGAVAGIIGQNRSDPPFPGSAGERADEVTVPSYMISQADAQTLKDGVGSNATIDPDDTIPTVGTMVSTSSRGPASDSFLVKPEIGAPGASVSAVAGSGTGTASFGGTSGATPMVAGSAALVLATHPGLSPLETKSYLMNTAYRGILTAPVALGGVPAEVTRIGNGEVRVDAAEATDVAAWDQDNPSAALSFGFHEVSQARTLTRTVVVHNYAGAARTFDIATSFRDPSDETGAVTLVTPASVAVPANGEATFDVLLTLQPSLLDPWNGDSGAGGIDPTWLTALEFDGAITLSESGGPAEIHLAWQVLPRRASDVSVRGHALKNVGQGDAWMDAFTLFATSPDLPPATRGDNQPIGDIRYGGYRSFSGMAEACGTSDTLIQLAISLWEPVTHGSVPFLVGADIDTDRNGTPDYEVFTMPVDIGLSDARSVVWMTDLSTGDTYPMFYTEHDVASRNFVLSLCSGDIGVPDDALGPLDVSLFAYDYYFRGEVTDGTDPVTIEIGGPAHYLKADGEIVASFELLRRSTMPIAVARDPLSSSDDVGVLLLQRAGAAGGREALALVPPHRPRNVAAEPGHRSVTLNWDAPLSGGGIVGDAGITGYRIRMSRNDGVWRTVVADTGSLATSRTITGLDNGARYRFRVSALNVAGPSRGSVPTDPVVPHTLPSEPLNVAATAWTRSVTLTWERPERNGGLPITNYRIQMSLNGGAWTNVTPDTPGTRRAESIGGLTAGGRYRFRVAAVADPALGPGPWSVPSIVVRPTG